MSATSALGRGAVAPRRARRRNPPTLTALLFLAPFLLCYAAFLLYPMALGAWMSLYDLDLLTGEGDPVGLGNFARLFADPIFLRTIWNTTLFVLLTTPAFVAIGLVLALALNNPLRTSAVLRAVFFSTSVLSVTIVTLVWQLVYSPANGLAANLFRALGLEPVAFLANTTWALPAVALTTVWWIIGLPLVLFLAALQQIPREVYEAAALDRANRWRVFSRITFPAIRRTVVLVAVIEVVKQYQVFGQTFLMTQGGPNNASRTMVQFIYEAAFRDWQLGFAAAAAQVLFSIMLVTALLQYWAGSRRDAG